MARELGTGSAPMSPCGRMSLAKTLLRFLRRVADWFPLTWLGIFVAGGAWAALEWLAYPQLDLVGLVIGYAALGLVRAAGLIVLIGALCLLPAPAPLRRLSHYPLFTLPPVYLLLRWWALYSLFF